MPPQFFSVQHEGSSSSSVLSSGLKTHTQLLSHQSVPLHFNQQRHHPYGLNLTSHISSKLFNAKG